MFLITTLVHKPALLASLLALAATPDAAAASNCCEAGAPDSTVVLPTTPLVAHQHLAAPWSYATPAAPSRSKRTVGGPQLDYMLKRHLWLSGGVNTVATGLPLTTEASNSARTSFSQAGLGLGYTLSPAVRAITSWRRGLGTANVSPGSQFTVGVALRY